MSTLFDTPFVDTFSVWAPLVIDVALKSLLLLAATAVAALIFRKQSAATVHRLWTLGFVGCLVLPGIAWLTPSWNLAVLPTGNEVVESLGDLAAKPLAEVRSASEGSMHSMELPNPNPIVKEKETSAATVVSETSTLVEGPIADAEPWRLQQWLTVGLICWLSITAICLLRTIWQYVTLNRLVRQCQNVRCKKWTADVAEASQALGLERKVGLLKLDEALTPMLAGVLRPAVVLPGDADDWSQTHRRSVLVHELAHAKRYDVLTQTLASLVCALHWFNPFAWYGLSQLRKLRELACDDLAVASGQQPADYADVLLSVARSYRHRNLATTVGMARRANVESRILAILDRARSHVSLSRRAARVLFVSAAAMAVLIGSMRLESQAEPAAEVLVNNESETKTPADDDLYRTMKIRITDEAGKPLADSKLTVSVWYVKDYQGEKTPKKFTADSDGAVDIKLPRRLKILRMWPSKPGYVPEFVNFAQGSHDEGLKIPDHFDFQLAKGTKLSGTVVDEQGQPIEDVVVAVSISTPNPAPGEAIVSSWLTDDDFQEGDAITDKNGKWSINNAPAPALVRLGKKNNKQYYDFRLKFTHADYASDSEWGVLQKKQQLTTSQLRDGTAKLVLPAGLTLSGSVIDAQGDPVTEGVVVWRDDHYDRGLKFAAPLNESGRFETDILAAGKHPITVIAKGFLPVRRVVAVNAAKQDILFMLKPGKRLVVKVVDTQGKPIPNAYFRAGGSRVFAPVDEVVSKVIDSSSYHSHIPSSADKQGVYTWNGAPVEAVKFSISARGYTENTVTLTATEKEQVVTLQSKLQVSGKVTDTKTGELIPSFRVIPVIASSSGRFQTWSNGTAMGKQGQFEIDLTGFSDSKQYKLRLEADGYRSVLSDRTFEWTEGSVTQDFSLEPAAVQVGQVIDQAGNPVPDAVVVQITPDTSPSMNNAELKSDWQGPQIRTNKQGKFRLTPMSEPVRIRVLHAAGVAEVIRQPGEAIGTIQLQPWASISGRLTQAGKPIAKEFVNFFVFPSEKQVESKFPRNMYHTETDSEGRFEFKRLPPIAGALAVHVGPSSDTVLTSSCSVPLVLKAGEHRKVSLSEGGLLATGRVELSGPGAEKNNLKWSRVSLVSRNEISGEGLNPSEPFQISWLSNPKHIAQLFKRRCYFIKIQPGGKLRIHGVKPGTYDLALQIFVDRTAFWAMQPVSQKVVTVEITAADVARGTKDLGTIEIECRSGSAEEKGE